MPRGLLSDNNGNKIVKLETSFREMLYYSGCFILAVRLLILNLS